MPRLLCAFLICVVASVGAASGKEVKAPASPTTNAKASALLENARWYRDAKDYAAAEKLILEALEAAPDDQLIKSQAKSLWDEVRQASQEKQTAEEAEKKAKEDGDTQKTRNQLAAQLDEARRLSAQGKNDEASQAALAVLKETDDPQLVKDAKDILANNQPSFVGLIRVIPQRLFTIGGWVLDIALAIILVFLPLLLIRSVYSMYRRYSWRKAYGDWDKRGSVSFYRFVKGAGVKYQWWVFRGVEDPAKTGVGEAIIDSIKKLSEARPTGYADLLSMERMKFQPVLFEFSEVHVDPLPALEAVNLQIGGVTLGGIAQAVSSLKTWFGANVFWIKGTVFVDEELITVRLTRPKCDGTSFTVTASGKKAKVNELAEAVTYMMFYSLAKKSDLSEVEAANKLREGRDLLGEYVSGQDPEQLEAAYKVFRSLRVERPDYEEVYLYEGIALELLEQHDEALKRFRYLQKSSSAELLNKAKYNEAVSLFRTYRDKDAFDESISILNDLLDHPADEKLGGDAPKSLAALVASPLKTLALATKANVIAHQPIFWRDHCPIDPGEAASLKKKEVEARQIAAGKRKIKEWTDEVITISTFLEKVLGKNPAGDGWDGATKQEVKWAINNAYGNVYLNAAVNFLTLPNSEDEAGQRLKYLKDAYKYFRECEMLLPPGVETLTNLATTLLGLCREDPENYSYDQVRAYLEEAKKVNPRYEYADYRLAKSWEQQGRIDEVLKVLRAFAKERTPTSKGFRELYRKYSLEIAKLPAEQDEPPEPRDTPAAKPATQPA